MKSISIPNESRLVCEFESINRQKRKNFLFVPAAPNWVVFLLLISFQNKCSSISGLLFRTRALAPVVMNNFHHFKFYRQFLHLFTVKIMISCSCNLVSTSKNLRICCFFSFTLTEIKSILTLDCRLDQTCDLKTSPLVFGEPGTFFVVAFFYNFVKFFFF